MTTKLPRGYYLEETTIPSNPVIKHRVDLDFNLPVLGHEVALLDLLRFCDEWRLGHVPDTPAGWDDHDLVLKTRHQQVYRGAPSLGDVERKADHGR